MNDAQKEMINMNEVNRALSALLVRERDVIVKQMGEREHYDIEEMLEQGKLGTRTCKVEYFTRCLHKMVDGYLCLIVEPKPVLSWIPISAFKSSTPIVDMPIKDLKQVWKFTFAKVWDDAIAIEVQVKETTRKLEFIGFENRDDTLSRIEKFIKKNVSTQDGSPTKKGNIVNTLLHIPMKKKKKEEEKTVDSTNFDDRGYKVSETLLKRFTKVKKHERLVNQYSCASQKLPGTLYLFNETICFDTVVNSGGNHFFMLNFDKLLKIALFEKNLPQYKDAIKITDRNGRSVIYSGFSDRDQAFNEICSIIEKAGTMLHYTITFRKDKQIAVIVPAPVLEQKSSASKIPGLDASIKVAEQAKKSTFTFTKSIGSGMLKLVGVKQPN
jgi:hypothetical protein